MEIIVVIVVIAVIAAKLLNSLRPVSSSAKAETLCASCVNVYRVRGVSGRELIFCNYTSDLRAIKFAVCECTGYRNRDVAPVARVAGFVRLNEIGNTEAFPATVIRIGPDQD